MEYILLGAWPLAERPPGEAAGSWGAGCLYGSGHGRPLGPLPLASGQPMDTARQKEHSHVQVWLVQLGPAKRDGTSSRTGMRAQQHAMTGNMRGTAATADVSPRCYATRYHDTVTVPLCVAIQGANHMCAYACVHVGRHGRNWRQATRMLMDMRVLAY